MRLGRVKRREISNHRVSIATTFGLRPSNRNEQKQQIRPVSKDINKSVKFSVPYESLFKKIHFDVGLRRFSDFRNKAEQHKKTANGRFEHFVPKTFLSRTTLNKPAKEIKISLPKPRIRANSLQSFKFKKHSINLSQREDYSLLHSKKTVIQNLPLPKRRSIVRSDVLFGKTRDDHLFSDWKIPRTQGSPTSICNYMFN